MRAADCREAEAQQRRRAPLGTSAAAAAAAGRTSDLVPRHQWHLSLEWIYHDSRDVFLPVHSRGNDSKFLWRKAASIPFFSRDENRPARNQMPSTRRSG